MLVKLHFARYLQITLGQLGQTWEIRVGTAMFFVPTQLRQPFVLSRPRSMGRDRLCPVPDFSENFHFRLVLGWAVFGLSRLGGPYLRMKHPVTT
jgi:hypothetical protein